ncbi:MAG: pentapeptide repeat-containing protein [Alphaproteobacteria bacterium]|nr:pentapeptide repeat-containing protein [Alphaproteobacteria bacterium]
MMSEKRSGEREGRQERGPPQFAAAGLAVFFGGLLLWTLLPWGVSKIPSSWLSPRVSSIASFWESNLKEYLPGLILLGLAGLTTSLAFWRGQQTDTQIEKAQEQFKEAQRQTRDQSFYNAIQMATDGDNPARVRAGWRMLHMLFDREESEDGSEYLETTRDMARDVLNLTRQTESMLHQDMEQLPKQSKETHITWLSWPFVREGLFKKSDATRTDRDVRQHSLNFLMKHPPQEWADDGKWDLSRCDLSDLTLEQGMLEHHDSEEKWKVVANGSHCLNMRVDPKADLSGSNFSHAKMTGAKLEGANLSDARFIGTDLRYVDLSGANLNGTSLDSADLRHCCLLDADLTEADLTKADLREATVLQESEKAVRFYRTRINAANFRGIKNGIKKDVSTHELKALLQGCRWNRKDRAFREPLLPDGIDPYKDIPDSSLKTKETGGRGWKPPQI